MPKRKRSSTYTGGRRRYTKRARTAPRRAYAGSMVPLASRGYRFNAPEVKSFDLSTTSYIADSNTPSITAMFVPIQGTAFANRIGTRVKVKSIQVQGYVANSLAYTQGGPSDGIIPTFTVRVAVVLDYQPNGALPTITDIYLNTGPVTGLNLNFRDRFKVLKQKTYVIDPYIVDTTTNMYASAVNQIKPIKIFKKCDIPVYFNSGNAGTVADLSSNAILLVCQSDAPTALAADGLFRLFTRCRFVDP